MTWVYIWLGVVALSIIIEFVTTDLVSVWFIFGGLLAMILALVDVDLIWQLVAFIALSAILLVLCRKPILKVLGNNKESTNADSLVGREFVLLTPILSASWISMSRCPGTSSPRRMARRRVL